MSFDHLNTNLYRCAPKSIPSKQSIPAPATKHITTSDEAKQSTSHPHSYYPQGRVQYPLKSKLDGPQTCSGHNGNNNNLLSLPGFKPCNVQPIRWSLNLLCQSVSHNPLILREKIKNSGSSIQSPCETII